MASGPHTFAVVGVFSAEQFRGNPLSIVAVRGNALTTQRKQLIAKEFGYTGTVFIHDAPNASLPRRIEIFTGKGEEVSFSGHCILGTAHYVFQCCEGSNSDRDKPQTTVFMTKAGPVPVLYNTQRQVAACSIPQEFHIHKSDVSLAQVFNVQPQIQIVPTIEKLEVESFPVVSIVKGMTFSLIDLSAAPEALTALEVGEAPDVELDKEWDQGYVGALYYVKKGVLEQAGEPTIHSIKTRVIMKRVEDPGTGSACSALACYLALQYSASTDTTSESAETSEASSEDKVTQKLADTTLSDKKQGSQRHVFAIQQGLEMGRACTIAVEVELSAISDGSMKVKNVTLSGKASFFVRGELART